MIYSDFRNKINSLLLYDANNPDEESDALIDQLIRSWMSEMQWYVDNYKVKNVNTYSETDFTVSCEGAYISLPSELEKLTKVQFKYPDNYPQEITVSDAGVSGVNLVYTLADGSTEDIRPTYESGDYTISWSGTQWEISDGTDIIYFSDDDVVSPDLVTTWEAVVPDAVVVEGAGTVAANLVYLRDGDELTFPKYSNGDYDVIPMYDTSGGGGGPYPAYYYIGLYEGFSGTNVSYYRATELLSATPVYELTFQVEDGDSPAPTVRVAVVSDFPELLPLPTVTKTDQCDEVVNMSQVKYDDRNDLLNPECNQNVCYKYAVDKRATELYINPYPKDDYTYGPQSVVVTWEGVKQDYDGSDEIPFGDNCVKNCSDYINAELSRKKSDKLNRYNSYQESYLRGRTVIFRSQQDKSRRRP